MTIALGIDTGGTYTDAVLVDHQSGQVLAGAKAVTTHHNLAVGIEEAVNRVFRENDTGIIPRDVDLVGLSTTLATNAIVEGQGSPICLLLIGYDADLIQQHGFSEDLATPTVVYVQGGHDGMGNEVAPLDEAQIRQAVQAYRHRVEAFAVSAFFSVRNPQHELRAKAIIEELTRGPDGLSMPVTCGHELSSRLNAIRRATTAALNARLIPLLRELITVVRDLLRQTGIDAPLMVTRGDGSLVRADWAIQRPIETILSGPAASVVGAWHLARRGDVWVVDMGGTTTDIAALRNGRPRLNPEGARIGRWRTMVEAIDVHTVGLGGDSQVQVAGPASGSPRWLTVGPRRVVPLAMLAARFPEIIDELQLQVEEAQFDEYAGIFVLPRRRAGHRLSDEDRAFLSGLSDTPRSIIALAAAEKRHRFLVARQVERLSRLGLVLKAGFTPTDALHTLGYFGSAKMEASRLGAELLANRAGLPVEDFCRRVVAAVSERVATELVTKVLSDEETPPAWDNEPSARALLNRAFGYYQDSGLSCRLGLKVPVVAIGAPVTAFFPRVAELLHTELVIPPHADVANAVGAVVGGVVQEARVEIQPLDGMSTGYRAYLPDGVHDFRNLEQGVAYVQQVMSGWLEAETLKAGAAQVEVKMKRVDHIAPIKPEWGGEIYLGTELTFTAVGRPGLEDK
ncbi:MAG: hydantoinase/oxoprolinase family protein [Chloroflexi bacterium]|nr:MAG: hydantoinase/oxoprolinase family protein [Chloroflexota bacterium]